MDIRPLWSLTIVASLAVAAVAQEQAAPVFRSTTDLVIVTATVTMRDGKPARGLLKEAFTIVEDGVPQTVSVFDTGDVPRLSRNGGYAEAIGPRATLCK